jgi:hypothetical protein
VICGDRDNSSMGRSLRVAGSRAPASTLIRAADAAPGITAPGVVISLVVRFYVCMGLFPGATWDAATQAGKA